MSLVVRSIGRTSEEELHRIGRINMKLNHVGRWGYNKFPKSFDLYDWRFSFEENITRSLSSPFSIFFNLWPSRQLRYNACDITHAPPSLLFWLQESFFRRNCSSTHTPWACNNSITAGFTALVIESIFILFFFFFFFFFLFIFFFFWFFLTSSWELVENSN